MNVTEHLLTCLGEEGSEIAQDVSKANRFGLDDTNFLKPDGPNNRDRLVNELNDLLGVAQLLVENGILPNDWACAEKQNAKKKKVIACMEYAQKVGALELIMSKPQERRPMTQDEKQAVECLGQVRYPPASWDKRFARHIQEMNGITDKEAPQVWRLFKRYRRQISHPNKTKLLRVAEGLAAPDFRAKRDDGAAAELAKYQKAMKGKS